MAPTEKSPKILIPPTKVDGGVSRLVEMPDGSGRVETWGPDGWRPGGADLSELPTNPPASRDLMRRLGIPESDMA